MSKFLGKLKYSILCLRNASWIRKQQSYELSGKMLAYERCFVFVNRAAELKNIVHCRNRHRIISVLFQQYYECLTLYYSFIHGVNEENCFVTKVKFFNYLLIQIEKSLANIITSDRSIIYEEYSIPMNLETKDSSILGIQSQVTIVWVIVNQFFEDHLKKWPGYS